jgi:uncharacterized membrane protein
MKGDRAWYVILGLAILGMLDALYLLLYQTKKVESLVCPVFGGGCEQVASSPGSYPAGIPDAIFGVVGYALAALTAAAIPHTTGRVKRFLAAAAVIGTLGAAGLSVFLVYAQPTKTGAWCFWCLMSAAISITMAPVAIAGARKIFRGERHDRQEELDAA